MTFRPTDSTARPARSVSAPTPWVAVAAIAVALALFNAATGWQTTYRDGVYDPDSMLRLLGVRELVDGKGWFDLFQPRLGPDGIWMHWSRLVDLPLAVIVAAFRPLVGAEGAELVMLNVWPPLLLVPFVLGLASIAHRLGGWHAVAWTLVLLLLAPAVTLIFRPMRIDHHNLQAVLIVWMMAGLVRADQGWKPAALAGAMAGFSLAIGMEMLLVIVAGTTGLCIAWVIEGARWRPALRGYGLSFAGVTTGLFLATVAPERWTTPACDALSMVYVAVAVIGGVGIALIARFPKGAPAGAADRVVRGGLLVGVGSLLLAVTAHTGPLCLLGPYAGLDPRLGPIWLDHVTEAKSIVAIYASEWWTIPLHYAAPVVASLLGLALVRSVARDVRPGLALLVGVVATSTLVGLIQVRGVVPAQTLGAAAAGALVAAARRLAADNPGRLRAALRYVWLPLCPLAWYFVMMPFADQEEKLAYRAMLASLDTCRAEIGAALETAPPGLIAAPSNLGSYLLMRTPHRVLAAPYHRNAAGLLLAEDILAGPDGVAALDRAGGRYVVICRSDSEVGLIAKRGPDGLVARLVAGERPGEFRSLVDTPVSLVLERAATAAAPGRPHSPDGSITGTVPPLGLRPTLD